MRDTAQFYGKPEHPFVDSKRRITFYEVCLTSCEDAFAGGAHLTELADLSEALESIYDRRANRLATPHLPGAFGASLEPGPRWG